MPTRRETARSHRPAAHLPVRVRARPHRFLATITALVACAALLASCTGARPAVIGEVYTNAGPGTLGLDGTHDTTPTLGWVEPGVQFYVTTYGSSSCPYAPTSLHADVGALEIEMTATGGEACTTDLGPKSYALDLPPRLRTAEAISVTLQFESAPAQHLTLERVR
jgi:hypothetical protein